MLHGPVVAKEGHRRTYDLAISGNQTAIKEWVLRLTSYELIIIMTRGFVFYSFLVPKWLGFGPRTADALLIKNLAQQLHDF